MRLVVALGGNALQQREETPDAEHLHRHVREGVAGVAGLALEHEIVLTHGNGPQVGLLAMQAELSSPGERFGLDVLGAESQGMIGYLLERELRNALPGREVATLLTQAVVAADDPAFEAPTKPIGPVLRVPEGERLARERGWTLAPDGGGVRRVVPSPVPREILQLASIRHLLDRGCLVIAAGGGGIPVFRDAGGALAGVEAVVDKDRSAALLAEGVGADGLILLTSSGGVYDDFGTEHARLLRSLSPAEMRQRRFDPGTMGPKVEAACRFASRPGRWAAIGAFAEVAAIVDGTAGTRIAAPPVATRA